MASHGYFQDSRRSRKMSDLPIPKSWNVQINGAILQAISLARHCLVSVTGRMANSPKATERVVADNERLKYEVQSLREELRLKDARMSRLPAQRRPHYSATERLSILELRAAQGWNLAQTARRFPRARALAAGAALEMLRSNPVCRPDRECVAAGSIRYRDAIAVLLAISVLVLLHGVWRRLKDRVTAAVMRSLPHRPERPNSRRGEPCHKSRNRPGSPSLPYRCSRTLSMGCLRAPRITTAR